MAPGRGAVRLLTTAICIGLYSHCLAVPQELTDVEKVAALSKLQSQSSDGVIQLTKEVFDRYIVGPARPFTLYVLADALHMRNQGNMKLGQVAREYGLVASTLRKATPGKVFLTRAEFTSEKELFGKLGIVSLPHLALIPPSLPVGAAQAVGLTKDHAMPLNDYPWSAETIAGWVTETAGLPAVEINRPSLLKSRFAPVFMLLFMASAAVLGYRLYHAPFLRHTWIYMAGSLVIYWFSVSGGMYIIIRGMPFVQFDQRTRSSNLFLPGQGQLGAEGYIMGTQYLLFGLAVAAGTHLLPRVRDSAARRRLGYALVAGGALLMRSIMGTHHWKTGMTTHWY
ncbi:hypothetical protein ACKKBG_A04710 [Auxenochlorella protothecoides x Auxenochlorella symbiontica]